MRRQQRQLRRQLKAAQRAALRGPDLGGDSDEHRDDARDFRSEHLGAVRHAGRRAVGKSADGGQAERDFDEANAAFAQV